MIKMIVFDMADTMVDGGNVVYRDAVNATGGYQLSLQEVLASAAGKEKRGAIAGLLGRNGTVAGEQVDAAYQSFKTALETAYANLDLKPIIGATSFLKQLRSAGIKVVPNTGYNAATAQSLIDKMGWKAGQEYDLLDTADQVTQSRPAPDMIVLAQAKLGIASAQHIVKVGDSAIDIEEGKNAACGYTVGVTTGAQTAAQISEAGPDFIIDRLEDLKLRLPLSL
ncbi:HAD family hydrolase [Phaeodactylibacter xiamenensis]|uniref:HAD family hydrolase n=1 Tax=Phaeodactylibacter xiamenensis TaxID=1524460 RepID=UPI0024A9732D|nr:HAD family hydrolase [Phaeodactylibacter xiamenensis]